jgi:hypothetical protein
LSISQDDLKIVAEKTYSPEELAKLQKTYPVKVDMTTLIAMSKKKLETPFETALVKKQLTIALPQNIEALAKESNVFKCILYCAKEAKMGMYILKSDYDYKSVFNQKQQLAFDAFSMVICSTEVPTCSKGKNLVSKAMCSAVNYIVSGHGIDSSYIKGKANILDLCFQTKNTKVKPIERKAIDMLINVARTKEFKGHFNSYLISSEEIKKNKGLSVSVNNELWSTSEKEFIKLYLEHNAIHTQYELDLKNVKSLSTIKAMAENIKGFQKKSASVKRLLKQLISTRMQRIYPRNKHGKVDKAFSKKKISEVMLLAEGTERLLCLNPSTVLQLVGKSTMPLSFDEKLNKHFVNKKNWGEYKTLLNEYFDKEGYRAKLYLSSLEKELNAFANKMNK